MISQFDILFIVFYLGIVSALTSLICLPGNCADISPLINDIQQVRLAEYIAWKD